MDWATLSPQACHRSFASMHCMEKAVEFTNIRQIPFVSAGDQMYPSAEPVAAIANR
jgi:hypothetical protein